MKLNTAGLIQLTHLVIQSNTGRKRLTSIGGRNPVSHEFIHDTDEKNCNGERIIAFLAKLLRHYPDSEIRVFNDNAKYFMGQNVREWLDKHPRITLNFLPAYAPNLNPTERIWRFTKKKLVKNTYYGKYKTFRAHVFRLLNHLSDYKEELKITYD